MIEIVLTNFLRTVDKVIFLKWRGKYVINFL